MQISCKKCYNWFTVALEQSGEIFKCPSCDTAHQVEIRVTQIASYAMNLESAKPKPGDLYFDIETTGLRTDAEITAISWIVDGEAFTWTNNKTLSAIPDEFITAWNRAERVVTFNGEKFDIPRLQVAYKMPEPKDHIDVMELCKAAGMNKGLKQLEEEYFLNVRPDEIKSWKGAQAVDAWNSYMRAGSARSLRLLQAYCAFDALSVMSFHNVLTSDLDDENRDALYEKAKQNVLALMPEQSSSGGTFAVPDGWAPIMPPMPPEDAKPQERWIFRKENPLTSIAGAGVCITGDTVIEREQLHSIIAAHGGTPLNSATRKTDFLVTNDTYKSSKILKAEKDIAEGSSLRIITEDELISLIKAARTFEAQ
jgi:BRCA1 C Terminus (BRCT) domain.